MRILIRIKTSGTDITYQKHENEPDHVLVGKNFLIAEDNGINLDMLKELLKEEGAACDCAKKRNGSC